MHSNDKHSPKPKKPSAKPSAVPGKPDRMAKDGDQGEGSYSGTREYQAGLRSYLKNASVEKAARDAAPFNAAEAREMEKAEETGRKHDTKTQASANGK